VGAPDDHSNSLDAAAPTSTNLFLPISGAIVEDARSDNKGGCRMPWTPDDAERHTHKAITPNLKELWAKVANERLGSTGDEGLAIREANAVVARQAERSA
jgi:hypothetical protein